MALPPPQCGQVQSIAEVLQCVYVRPTYSGAKFIPVCKIHAFDTRRHIFRCKTWTYRSVAVKPNPFVAFSSPAVLTLALLFSREGFLRVSYAVKELSKLQFSPTTVPMGFRSNQRPTEMRRLCATPSRHQSLSSVHLAAAKTTAAPSSYSTSHVHSTEVGWSLSQLRSTYQPVCWSTPESRSCSTHCPLAFAWCLPWFEAE